MTQNDLDFLKNHSVHFLEMALRTDKREIITQPDGYGKRTGTCGDTVTIFLIVRQDRIQSVSYDLDGCINTNACCNTLAFLAEGKTIEQAWEIRPEDIIDYLETLPANHRHCAELTVGAFYLALTNYREVKKSPWKKLYR